VLIALRSICERPNMYPSVGRGARRTLIRRFPFGIYYRTEKDGIVVVAVMHGIRSPRRWQRRT
jgi:plasmid stabilization system protein ParE